MKLRFKEGSKVQKVVLELFQIKEDSHKQAIKIIEEVTGCKILENSQLGFRWGFGRNYMWSYNAAYFDSNITEVPGYTFGKDSEGNNHHVFNKRKTKIREILNYRFNKEVRDVKIGPLEECGITDKNELTYYHWTFNQEDSGEVVMIITPKMFDLIDFTKSIENGESTIFVEQ